MWLLRNYRSLIELVDQLLSKELLEQFISSLDLNLLAGADRFLLNMGSILIESKLKKSLLSHCY